MGAAFAAGASVLCALPKDSRRRRATGGSTVDDADFTNSPCSLSFASSSLLVTPSSFANSCTRALPATALLTDEVERPMPARPRVISDGRSSLVLHGVLMSVRACSSQSSMSLLVSRRRGRCATSPPWTRPADPALRYPDLRTPSVLCRVLDAEQPGSGTPRWDASMHLAREACAADRGRPRNLPVPSPAPRSSAVRQPAFAAGNRRKCAPGRCAPGPTEGRSC
ncbi:hypothetical protein EV641_101369 [Rhodococcus sp. SMB37]|nr:hypothetical protein EV641_101369 [Rhodococcus sp. SMB37]